MTINEFEKRAAFQNEYDREIGDWKVIDIHQIPDVLNEQHEINFYCSNANKVFLLRLRNRKTEFYEKINVDSSDSITYNS